MQVGGDCPSEARELELVFTLPARVLAVVAHHLALRQPIERSTEDTSVQRPSYRELLGGAKVARQSRKNLRLLKPPKLLLNKEETVQASVVKPVVRR